MIVDIGGTFVVLSEDEIRAGVEHGVLFVAPACLRTPGQMPFCEESGYSDQTRTRTANYIAATRNDIVILDALFKQLHESGEIR